MALERTFIIVKPDGVQRGLTGEIISRLERRGLKIVGLKLMQIEMSLAEQHYGEHKGKPFYDGLVTYMTDRPVVVAVLEGPDAIEAVSVTVGATSPIKAAPGTIRGDLGLFMGRNLIHRSDGAESAEREINLFFRPEEIIGYERETDRWIIEE